MCGVTLVKILSIQFLDDPAFVIFLCQQVFPYTSFLLQVSEVTTHDDCRLSINGWFHTKTPPIFETPSYTPIENGLFGSNSIKMKLVDIDLESWINECYLKQQNISVIQNEMEENSETALCSFFRQESFQAISEILRSEGLYTFTIEPEHSE